MFNRIFIASFTLLSVVAMIGCGGGNKADQAIRAANSTNVARLVNLYTRHQLQNRGKGPASEAEFREYILKQNEATLSRMSVDKNDIDALFVSERDAQPFEIIYAVKGNSRGSNDAVVFETTGVNGKRLVGFTSGASREIEDEAEYKRLQSGEGVAKAKKS